MFMVSMPASAVSGCGVHVLSMTHLTLNPILLSGQFLPIREELWKRSLDIL
jgi:hypothetical protein